MILHVTPSPEGPVHGQLINMLFILNFSFDHDSQVIEMVLIQRLESVHDQTTGSGHWDVPEHVRNR